MTSPNHSQASHNQNRSHSGTSGRAHKARSLPSVDLLLTVDAMYLERVANDSLRKVAPKRFNRSGLAWLPVMHASHDQWRFTARFSNTLLANRLGKTSDWVVIEYDKGAHVSGQCTVVSETHGPRQGMRLIRGREEECCTEVKKTTRSSLHGA